MTAPEFKRSVRSWFVPALVVIAYAGLVVEFMLLIPLLREQGERAVQGRQARVQQCAFRSVSLAEQRWFADRGVISERDFARIVRILPSPADCRALMQQK